nr:glycosyltransferase [Pectinatus sottacetonis]
MIPKVQVFLSTYNGDKYLSQQLDSLINQSNVEVSILIRDDGSTDGTLSILQSYKKIYDCVDFYCGNNEGYAKSFLHLLTQNVKADYFAFCDQDDVWLPEKLSHGIKKIRENITVKNKKKPVLYATALKRVDENLNFLSMQRFKKLNLSLGAEFTRHRLAGCTFIFNSSLYLLLQKAYSVQELVCSHDRLATILCLSAGGKVIFDNNSYILFRRHSTNASVDGVVFVRKILKRFNYFMINSGKDHRLAETVFKYWRDFIDKKNYKIFCDIISYKKNIKRRLCLSISKEIDCGFWYYNIFIRLMILIKKF